MLAKIPDRLSTMSEVLEVYRDLVHKGSVGTLVVTLAREAVFGTEIMGECTPAGTRQHRALPQIELFKCALKFEEIWSTCRIKIEKACAHIRRSSKKK